MKLRKLTIYSLPVFVAIALAACSKETPAPASAPEQQKSQKEDDADRRIRESFAKKDSQKMTLKDFMAKD